MIVRILGEGQYDLDDHALDALNGLDNQIERRVESGDEAMFRLALARRCWPRVRVQRHRTTSPDSLDESDLILPPPDATHRRGPRAPGRRRPDPGLRQPAVATLPLHQGHRADRPDDPHHVPARRRSSSASSWSSSMSAAPAAPSRSSAIAAIGVAFWQWWSSDKVAMRAMRAREVTPGGGARAARHDRPALRPRRHAQAAGRASPTCRSPTRSRPAARPTGPWSA